MCTQMTRQDDHFKLEGNIEFMNEQPCEPAEKVIATKPQNNLSVSGELDGKFFILFG